MENITLFCFTTFCVELPLNSSREMVQNTLELHNLERSIDFNNEWLKFFEDRLTLINEQDVYDVVNNASYDAIGEHAYPALKPVWDAVNATREEGRDTYHCYLMAVDIINNAMNESYDFDMVPCIANITHAVQKILQKVEPIREEIERIQHYFNETVPSCYNSTNAVQCSNTTLWTIKDERSHLEKLIDVLMSKKETFYQRLKNDFKTCSTAINTKIKNASSLALREGIQCVETTKTPIHQST